MNDPGLVAASLHDQRLVALTHPPDHVNPRVSRPFDLVVIGGGTAGLVASIGAGLLGARVALLERGRLGGDCLNAGCVPSKALLRAAHAAQGARTAYRFGIRVGPPEVDFARVMERVRGARAAIAPHDSAAQVKSHGVQLFLGDARFAARDAVEVAGQRLSFRRAIIATGGRAAVPPIAGLAQAGYLTNETIFALTERPAHLAILGGGPLGCEFAQAFRRLGSEVTLIQRGARLLPREDEDVSELLRRTLASEGVNVVIDGNVSAVERRGGRTRITLQGGAAVDATALLVATGRSPNVEELGLAVAGIDIDAHGVVVDRRLRTTNRNVFAAGDVASPYKFTHAADALARVALQNALFLGRKRASALVVPWSTFTDPEVARVGIGWAEARTRRDVRTHTVLLADMDRAIVDGETEGLARIHVGPGGRILGATLVARQAGDMLGEIVLAMTSGMRLRDVGRAILPYPTRAEVWKRLADDDARTRLTPTVRAAFERYLRWWR